MIRDRNVHFTLCVIYGYSDLHRAFHFYEFA